MSCNCYTDGSYSNDKAGYGIVVIHNNEEKEFYGSIIKSEINEHKLTNQVAELYAIYKCLDILDKLKIKNANLYTDSMYSLNAVTNWYKKWEINGWKTANGKKVLNSTLIKSILFKLESINIIFNHVKGHSGDKYNTRVDHLANIGRNI